MWNDTGRSSPTEMPDGPSEYSAAKILIPLDLYWGVHEQPRSRGTVARTGQAAGAAQAAARRRQTVRLAAAAPAGARRGAGQGGAAARCCAPLSRDARPARPGRPERRPPAPRTRTRSSRFLPLRTSLITSLDRILAASRLLIVAQISPEIRRCRRSGIGAFVARRR